MITNDMTLLNSEITKFGQTSIPFAVSESSIIKGAIGIFHGCWLCLIDSVKELPDSEVKSYLLAELSYGIPVKDMGWLYRIKKRVTQMVGFAMQHEVDEKIMKLLEEARDALHRLTLNRIIKYLDNGGEF
jgi:hypothetical protein